MRAFEQAQLDSARYRYRVLRTQIRTIALLLLIVALLILGILGYLSPLTPKVNAPTNIPPGTLYVNFGLQRSAISRSILIIVNHAPTQVTPGAFARLTSDLKSADGNDQLPAQQVSLLAVPFDATRLQVTATVNPVSPEAVGSGTYRGTIVVEWSSASSRVPILVFMANRGGRNAAFAFILLLVGATLGLAVKWVTEALSSLAAARWRLEGIQRSLGNKTLLPYTAASQLEEIENKVARQDITDLHEAFARLEAGMPQLRVFASALTSVQNEVQLQRNVVRELNYADTEGDIDGEFVAAIIRAEEDQVERIRSIEWPWKASEDVMTELRDLLAIFRSVSLALQDSLRGQGDEVRRVLELARRGDLRAAADLYNTPGHGVAALQPTSPKASTGEQSRRMRRYSWNDPDYVIVRYSFFGIRGPMQWITSHPRALAAAASVLVVSGVGLQLEYLSKSSFAGSLSEWLGLLMWAGIVELSGVSVLDVVARLSTGGRGATPVR
jgi:hypothetical protein